MGAVVTEIAIPGYDTIVDLAVPPATTRRVRAGKTFIRRKTKVQYPRGPWTARVGLAARDRGRGAS